MRKEAGFNVTDHINVTIEGSEKVTGIAVARQNDIMGDTLADSVKAETPTGFTKKWDINGENVTIGVKKV